MKEINKIPNKGQLFAFSAESISSVIIKENDNNYTLTSKNMKNELLNHKYLIFRYLGNGLAREYYSSKIFNLVMSDSFNDTDILNKIPSFNIVCSNNYEFYKGYKQVLRYPLLVQTSTFKYSRQMFEVDNQLKEEIISNNAEDEIVKIIEEFESSSRNNLIKQMNKIIEKNHEIALEENRRLKLKKTY